MVSLETFDHQADLSYVRANVADRIMRFDGGKSRKGAPSLELSPSLTELACDAILLTPTWTPMSRASYSKLGTAPSRDPPSDELV